MTMHALMTATVNMKDLADTKPSLTIAPMDSMSATIMTMLTVKTPVATMVGPTAEKRGMSPAVSFIATMIIEGVEILINRCYTGGKGAKAVDEDHSVHLSADSKQAIPRFLGVLQHRYVADSLGALIFMPDIVSLQVPSFGQLMLATVGAGLALVVSEKFLRTTPEILPCWETPCSMLCLSVTRLDRNRVVTVLDDDSLECHVRGVRRPMIATTGVEFDATCFDRVYHRCTIH